LRTLRVDKDDISSMTYNLNLARAVYVVCPGKLDTKSNSIWNVTPCSMAEVCQRFVGSSRFQLPDMKSSLMKQKATGSSETMSTCTTLHGVTSQILTFVFIASTMFLKGLYNPLPLNAVKCFFSALNMEAPGSSEMLVPTKLHGIIS
jgi:hypothetical protein